MDEKTVPATKARQGRQGYQMVIVLFVSLALAVLVWLALALYSETIDTHSVDQSGVSADQPLKQ